jgi:hypothetical protein
MQIMLNFGPTTSQHGKFDNLYVLFEFLWQSTNEMVIVFFGGWRVVTLQVNLFRSFIIKCQSSTNLIAILKQLLS